MTIERSEELSEIKLTQVGLIKKIMENHPIVSKRVYKTPAAEDLFDVLPDSDIPIDKALKTKFLSLIMSLMYLARLTRPDILLPVTFLATRTQSVTERDYQHAMRILSYLSTTMDIGITINCTDLQLYDICDASHIVHTDGKGHTGYILALGSTLSYLHGRSGKQKLVSQSSTEAELIAAVESLKMAVWIRNIITELQISELQPITLYQDNKSNILFMTQNTKKNKMRHVISKMAYVRRLHVIHGLDIEYLPTEDMTADVLTKPLQGELFNKHRDNMMYYTLTDTPATTRYVETYNVRRVKVRRN
jgi:hypothetical protein